MLELARDRTAGTVPGLVTPEHTRRARAILGADRLLLPGHFVLPETDVERARAIARASPVGTALQVVNYAANLRRLGFGDDDLAGAGSDRLIDALVLHGDPASIVAGLLRHRAAGADHIGIYPLGEDPLGTLRTVARAVSGASKSGISSEASITGTAT